MSGRRSQARRYAVLALYQWQMTGQEPAAIMRHFFDDPAWMQVIAEGLGLLKDEQQSLADAVYDLNLFQELLRGVPEQVEDLDRQLATVLDRPLRQVTPVDLAILRLGVYELAQSPQIPFRAILNETVELAKEFGSTDDSHRYVNGILDRLARVLRPAEFSTQGGGGATSSSAPSPDAARKARPASAASASSTASATPAAGKRPEVPPTGREP